MTFLAYVAASLLVVAGVAWIYPPAGCIAAGALLWALVTLFEVDG